MDLMQGVCKIIAIEHTFRGLGVQFSKQKNVPYNYSRLKLPFYNRFTIGDTHVGILGKSIVKWQRQT